MGIKKMFKSKDKDMTKEQSKEFLQQNGVVVKDDANYHRRKFKFGEFSKFSKDQAKNISPLQPILPNSEAGGYGNYENPDNNEDLANTGYGYDEYASDFRGNSGGKSTAGSMSDGNGSYSPYSSQNENSGYNGFSSSSYGYSEDKDSTLQRKQNSTTDRRQNSTADRKKQNSTADRRQNVTTDRRQRLPNDSINASRKPLKNPASNYDFDPYASSTISSSSFEGYGNGKTNDTGIFKSAAGNENESLLSYRPARDLNDGPSLASEIKPSPLYKTATNKTSTTYDPFAPGEEPYNADAYDADSFQHDDNSTIKGDANTQMGMPDGSQGSQFQQQEQDQEQYQHQGQIQEQEQEQEQRQAQEQDFDPYAQQAEVQTQNDLDLNSYTPGEQNQQTDYTPYDSDEYEDNEVDEEEEEVNRIIRQTKDVRENTVKSSQNILNHLRQANDTASNTLGVLGSQREKMYEMEKNMNLMKTQQRFVDGHVKDLEHYSRGLFHIKASNPFTRKSRKKAKEDAFLMAKQADRERDEELNGSLYRSQRDIVDQLKGENDINVKSELREKYEYERRMKEASKYLTDDHDEEDERMEVDIGSNIEEAQKLANNLKKKANAVADEINSQNTNLKEISEKVDHMDDKIVMTTNRIRGI